MKTWIIFGIASIILLACWGVAMLVVMLVVKGINIISKIKKQVNMSDEEHKVREFIKWGWITGSIRKIK